MTRADHYRRSDSARLLLTHRSSTVRTKVVLLSGLSMPLEMRGVCERCGAALAPADEAYICTYECTFCANCTHAMTAICPNCSGELVRRPRRAPTRQEGYVLCREPHGRGGEARAARLGRSWS